MEQTNHAIKLVLSGELPDLNQFINALNKHRYVGSLMKKTNTEFVMWEAKNQLKGIKIEVPVFVEFHWYCKNRKKDKDNVAFAKKFILDGLQLAGTILQDNWQAIKGFSDTFYVDSEQSRIEIIIKY